MCDLALQSPGLSIMSGGVHDEDYSIVTTAESVFSIAQTNVTTTELEKLWNQLKNIQTGAMMWFDRVDEIIAAIDYIKAKLVEGKATYKQVVQAGASKEETRKASTGHAGEKFTQAFGELCSDKVLLNMMVKLPPAGDVKVMRNNEDKLRMLIRQCNPQLAGYIMEMWTSSWEIGQVSQSTGYVRLPYLFGEQVMFLCQLMCMINSGTHISQASVAFDGRNPLVNFENETLQWDAIIGDNKLPQLTYDDEKQAPTR